MPTTSCSNPPRSSKSGGSRRNWSPGSNTSSTTTTSALFEGIISATSDPSDACPLALTDTVWIEGNYDRFFSDSGGTIPFVGGNAYWHVQKLVDAFSRGQDIDNDGYPISLPVLC